ncbi:MAG: hypothetical protein ACLT46_16900 [Hungatella sp.]
MVWGSKGHCRPIAIPVDTVFNNFRTAELRSRWRRWIRDPDHHGSIHDRHGAGHGIAEETLLPYFAVGTGTSGQAYFQHLVQGLFHIPGGNRM